MRYLVWGEEICPDTDRPHLQGYVEWHHAHSVEAMQLMFARPGLHLEDRKGTAGQASNYCKKIKQPPNKDGTPVLPNEVVFEFGVLANPGKRKDLDNVRELVYEGLPMRLIVPECSSFQSMRGAELVLKYFEQGRKFKTYVVWLWGPPGTGKSRFVNDKHPDDLYIHPGGKWFEGYDAHETVLLEEYRPESIDFRTLLLLLDRYPLRVECKGGTRQFLAKTLYVTTPNPPEWYVPQGENPLQLLRRISKIVKFPLEDDNPSIVVPATI
jgi:hypothetical protein